MGCSFLGPQVPPSCVTVDALQLQGEAKALSHPVPKTRQAIEQGQESLFQGAALWGSLEFRELTSAFRSASVWALDVLQ